MHRVLEMELASQRILPDICCKKVSVENGPDASFTYMGAIRSPNVDSKPVTNEKMTIQTGSRRPRSWSQPLFAGCSPCQLPASLQEATAVVIYLYSEDWLSGIVLSISMLAMVFVLQPEQLTLFSAKHMKAEQLLGPHNISERITSLCPVLLLPLDFIRGEDSDL